MTITPDLESFLNLVQSKTGLIFGAYQYQSLKKIINERIKCAGITGCWDYLRFLGSETVAARAEWDALIHRVSVPKTLWFRNPEQIEAMSRDVLPAQVQKRNAVHILSAGCATGEEPYSIWIAIMESQLLREDTKLYITATDIDNCHLDVARAGIYREAKTREIPERIRAKYFQRYNHDSLQVKPELRAGINFVQHNLLFPPYPTPPAGKWDVIFCRNVLLYFAEQDKNKVLERLFALLAPDGILFLGYAEFIGQALAYTPVKFAGAYGYQSNANTRD